MSEFVIGNISDPARLERHISICPSYTIRLWDNIARLYCEHTISDVMRTLNASQCTGWVCRLDGREFHQFGDIVIEGWQSSSGPRFYLNNDKSRILDVGTVQRVLHQRGFKKHQIDAALLSLEAPSLDASSGKALE